MVIHIVARYRGGMQRDQVKGHTLLRKFRNM